MQTARRPYLENGATKVSSSGKDETPLVDERLREFGFYVGALQRSRRIQRSQQYGVDKASGRRWSPDGRKSIGGDGAYHSPQASTGGYRTVKVEAHALGHGKLTVYTRSGYRSKQSSSGIPRNP